MPAREEGARAAEGDRRSGESRFELVSVQLDGEQELQGRIERVGGWCQGGTGTQRRRQGRDEVREVQRGQARVCESRSGKLRVSRHARARERERERV